MNKTMCEVGGFLFFPKMIVCTKGVESLMLKGKLSTEDVSLAMEKHFKNQGEECKEDNKLNADAIKYNEGRVFSVFTINGIKLYYITDGLGLEDAYNEYPLLTILLPEEY